MALSDFEIFQDFVYRSFTEVLDQQVGLFNEASNNALSLSVAPISGSFATASFFQRIQGLIRRRDPFSDDAVASTHLTMGAETEVKVAAGTPPIRSDKAWFEWIKQNPELAGSVVGRQLAIESMADMLNTALGAVKAALKGVPAVSRDIDTDINFVELTRTAALFGDRAQDIQVWAMHSAPLHGLYVNALQNANGLFSFGTVKVLEDGFGRRFIVSDSPALAEPAVEGEPQKYSVLGLQRYAARVSTNDDFNQVELQEPGYENIRRTYQAEWTFNLGVKGFSWNTAAGAAPKDAALFTSTNWVRKAASHKDLAGVLLTGPVDI